MRPPGFAKSILDMKGLRPPYCMECLGFAAEWGTFRSLCLKYGAYVNLHSSCPSFERRVGASTPFVAREQMLSRFNGRVDDVASSKE